MPRHHPPTAEPPVARPQPRRGEPVLELQCPECTQTIRVPQSDLVEGAAVHCGHCGSEPELTQEFEDVTGKTRWILVDPFADYDEDETRA
jgi:predicted Zn finger-like uncharacterized protein